MPFSLFLFPLPVDFESFHADGDVLLLLILAVDHNEIQANANNQLEHDDLTPERNATGHEKNSMISGSESFALASSPSPSFFSRRAERTTSSSSSEQLIPKEKQTGNSTTSLVSRQELTDSFRLGMYYPAFGSSAALQLAEKYHCEWIQDLTSPSHLTAEKRSTSMEAVISSDLDDHHSRIVRQHQTIGDDDEFYLSPQRLVPSHSDPNFEHVVVREPLRERSYSLTTLDAYARLDITRDTLEQMWLSLLDLAFSDKDDFELGEYKLRHIIGLSHSYSNMNETIIEKSRSHGDIFSSTTSRSSKLTSNSNKSKSFDVTSLLRPNTSDASSHDAANVGLLQGAAISEPFVDRLVATSTHSDTEANLLDLDLESIPSLDQDQLLPEEEYSPMNQTASPVLKEPLNYVFHYPHQLDHQDEYEFEANDDLSDYLTSNVSTANRNFGEEDKELCMSLGFDDDEAADAQAAAVAAHIQPRDTYAELAAFRPHSLSTIPSSRESQYESSVDDSDDIPDRARRNTLSAEQDVFPGDEPSEDEHDDRGEIGSDFSSPQSRPLSSIQSPSRTPPEVTQVRNRFQPRAFEATSATLSYLNIKGKECNPRKPFHHALLFPSFARLSISEEISFSPSRSRSRVFHGWMSCQCAGGEISLLGCSLERVSLALPLSSEVVPSDTCSSSYHPWSRRKGKLFVTYAKTLLFLFSTHAIRFLSSRCSTMLELNAKHL